MQYSVSSWEMFTKPLSNIQHVEFTFNQNRAGSPKVQHATTCVEPMPYLSLEMKILHASSARLGGAHLQFHCCLKIVHTASHAHKVSKYKISGVGHQGNGSFLLKALFSSTLSSKGSQPKRTVKVISLAIHCNDL